MSAALAAFMAHGLEARDAAERAQQYVASALLHAQRFGMGKLIPNKLFASTFHGTDTP
jgi:hydroxymethylpyrimidine/phosphomethylpyrimidine kinase